MRLVSELRCALNGLYRATGFQSNWMSCGCHDSRDDESAMISRPRLHETRKQTKAAADTESSEQRVPEHGPEHQRQSLHRGQRQAVSGACSLRGSLTFDHSQSVPYDVVAPWSSSSMARSPSYLRRAPSESASAGHPVHAGAQDGPWATLRTPILWPLSTKLWTFACA